jgi:hypothetical protein
MRDLVNLPASVRNQIERAHTLAQTGQPQAATNALQSALVELARSTPELAGLLMGTQMGFTQLTFTHTEEDVRTTRTPRQIFGITVGEDVSTVTTGRTVTRTIRFS